MNCIVKIVLGLMVCGPAAYAESRSKEDLSPSVPAKAVVQQVTKCGCSCESRPSEIAKLAAGLEDILSAVQQQERKAEQPVRLQMY